MGKESPEGAKAQIGELLSRLEEVQKLQEWAFKQTEEKAIERLDFDDSSWKKVKGDYTWSTAAGTAWLRRELVFPSIVEGISLEGRPVDLSVVAVSGVEVFLDGRRLVKYNYWADTRACNLRIIDKIYPSQRYLLALRFPKGDGLGMCQGKLRIGLIEEMVFELSTVMEEINFVEKVLLKNKENLKEKFFAAIEALDLEALKRRDWPRILSSLKKTEKVLSFFQSRAKEYKVYLVGHSHIDMNWLWPWEETIKVCQRDFESVNQLMEEFPELHFSQSQAAVYEIVREKDPALFNKVKQRIREKRWEATSSTWVEGDLNLAAGEALVRQLLYAKTYSRRMLGADPKICWGHDVFGHSVSYPQILAKAGIKYHYFRYCGKNLPIFWWEAPDGSRVLTYNGIPSNLFIKGIIVKNVVLIATEMARCGGIKSSMYLFGIGDHGGGPTRRDILTKMELDKRPALPSLVFSSAENFYQAALKEKRDYPVVKDELNCIFEGCYTTHADIKKANREGENLLLTAEVLVTLASLSGCSYPGKSFEKAWKKVCFNQFHDILPGAAIHSSYAYSGKLAQEVKQSAQKIIQDSMSFLSSRIKTESKEKKALALIVFNQLGWQRNDLVAVDLPEKTPQPFRLVDEKYNLIPFQVEGKKLVFVARKVPAFGYRTYWMVPGEKTCPSQTKLYIDEGGKMESSDYLLQVDPATGVIVRLYDKKAGREVFYPCSLMEKNPDIYLIDRASNLFRLLQEAPHYMSSWILGNINKTANLCEGAQVRVIEEGPVRVVLSVHRSFAQSLIEQRIIVYQDLDRIDFETRIDWQEKGSHQEGVPMLRVLFHLDFSSPEASFEIPFGSIKRATLGEEVPALRWVDVSQADYGVSLINDSKHGHQVEGNRISLTLLRSPYDPDALPDLGVHYINYALYPHRGRWKKGQTIRRAAEFNQPFLAQWQQPHSGDIPSSFGLLNIEPDNLVVSGLKRAENGKGIILRFYETEGKKTVATLMSSLPFASCSETNLLEEKEETNLDSSRGKTRMEVLPHEIRTLQLETQRWPIIKKSL